MSIVKEQCFQPSPNTRECAFLLQRLDYPDILSITMTKVSGLVTFSQCFFFLIIPKVDITDLCFFNPPDITDCYFNPSDFTDHSFKFIPSPRKTSS